MHRSSTKSTAETSAVTRRQWSRVAFCAGLRFLSWLPVVLPGLHLGGPHREGLQQEWGSRKTPPNIHNLDTHQTVTLGLGWGWLSSLGPKHTLWLLLSYQSVLEPSLWP